MPWKGLQNCQQRGKEDVNIMKLDLLNALILHIPAEGSLNFPKGESDYPLRCRGRPSDPAMDAGGRMLDEENPVQEKRPKQAHQSNLSAGGRDSYLLC